MNRTQTACYALLASAFVLAGLLLVTVTERHATPVQADQVVADGGITFLTAQTRTGQESLFVLANATGILNVYTLDVGRQRLDLAGSRSLNQLFR